MRYRLTKIYQDKLTQLIRAGTFEHVASEACGVPGDQYDAWLKRGAEQKRGLYRKFRARVIQAKAEARAMAESATRTKDPRGWLKHGPGKDRPGEPGWSNAPSAAAPEADPLAAI